MTAKPHDALFKSAFEKPEDAADLMRSVLPAPITEVIAWDTLAREAGSFVDPELGDRHSDLLFSARICDEPALIYVLLEHQSSNDHDMPLRMLEYLVLVLKRYRKENTTGPLPLVLPLLISHTPEGWSAPISFHELFSPLPSSIPELARLIPSFSLLVEDLAHIDNDELKARALAVFPKLALWCLRDARDTPRFLANLRHWADTLTEALRTPHGTEAVGQLFRYVALVGGEMKFERFRAKLREQVPQAEDIAMTFAEQLRREGREMGRKEGRQEGREEGREEGRQEGREEGRQEGRHLGQLAMLQKLLTLEFGELAPEQLARLHAATDAELERYLERALNAETLEAVFEG